MPSLILLGGGAAAPTGPITLTAVNGGSSAIVEKRGGTVVTLTGTGFDTGMTVEVLSGLTVVGTGYVFDPVFDLTATSLKVGMPALDPGVYDLQVTNGVNTAQLTMAIEAMLHAEELKVHEVRRGFAAPWDVGPRILTNHTIDLGAL